MMLTSDILKAPSGTLSRLRSFLVNKGHNQREDPRELLTRFIEEFP